MLSRKFNYIQHLLDMNFSFLKSLVSVCLFFSFFINASDVFAQNFLKDAIKKGKCKKFVKWTEPAYLEYPNDDINRLRRPKQLKLIYNLYSDKYFEPIFGKKFNDLSEGKSNSLYSKGRSCKLRPYSLTEALKIGTRVPTKVFSNQTTKEKVRQINLARYKYEKVVGSLNETTSDLSLSIINDYKYDLQSTYSILLQSEINALSELISKKEPIVANFELIKNLKKELEQPNTYSTLLKIDDFKSKNYDAFSLINQSEKSKFNAALEKKAVQILIGLMEIEKEKISSIPLTFDGIKISNESYQVFNNKYNFFSKFLIVEESYQAFKQRKTEVILNNSSRLIKDIKLATKINKLNEISVFYLNNSDYNNNQINSFEKSIATKINAIKQDDLKRKKKERERQIYLANEQKRIKVAKELAKLKKMLNETTPTGEPTDSQMKFAVLYQLQGTNESFNNLSNISNPNTFGEKFQEILGAVYSGTKVSLKSFSKYACVKSNSKPGYACDYLAELEISGGLGESLGSNQFFNNFTGAEVRTARFLKVKGYWMIVEFLN